MARGNAAVAAAISAVPRIETVKVAELKPAAYNPRTMDALSLAALEKSLTRFGVVEPIIWNSRSGNVVGGHQRLKILRANKVKQTSIIVVDLDDAEEKALNVALNSPKLAGDFTDALQALLTEIEHSRSDLFAELRLGELRSEVLMPEGRGDPDDVADAVPTNPRTEVGDLYVLGNHRLYCGDSTHPDSLAQLLQGVRVDALVTDPPYGVAYGEKTAAMADVSGGSGRQVIANDARSDYREWFGSWLALIPWAQKATFFICMSGQELHNLRLAIDDTGLKWGDYLVWVKNAPVLTRKDYNAKHEWIAFGALEHEIVMFGWPETHRFFGGKKRSTVLEYDRPTKSELHPTMKPVNLFRQLIEDGSPAGGIVLDLFGGSGTTMIACELAGRCARLIELDRGYADVIVDRWQSFTGKKAELQRGNAAIKK